MPLIFALVGVIFFLIFILIAVKLGVSPKKLEDEMRTPEDDFHNNILRNFSLDVDYTKRMNFNDSKVFFEGLSYNFPEYTIKKEEDKEGPSLDQLNKAHELDKKNRKR